MSADSTSSPAPLNDSSNTMKAYHVNMTCSVLLGPRGHAGGAYGHCLVGGVAPIVLQVYWSLPSRLAVDLD
jgi:hypothetical protein